MVVTVQKLSTHFDRLQKISEASIEELSEIKGIRLAKEAQIKAVFEIGRRVANQTSDYKSKELTSPEKVFKLMKSKIKDYHKKHFYIISLNSRNYLIAEISIGSLNASIVHQREVFVQTIKSKAPRLYFFIITPEKILNHQKTIWL